MSESTRAVPARREPPVTEPPVTEPPVTGPPSITVLLAAYNGAQRLSAQVDSILAQSVPCALVIQDDGSTDDTLSIARRYARDYPDRVQAFANDENSGGAKWNFLRLVLRHRAEYLLLCDQDDVWQPDKIERSLACMRGLEARHGAGCPLLVHTDMAVVDDGLRVIAPSFHRREGLMPQRSALHQIMVQNVAAGCTMLYNRALADRIRALPAECIMHDWWLALIAAAFGHIGYVDAPTVLYRQHGGNQIGAHNARSPAFILKKMRAGVRESLDATYRQAAAFLALYGPELTGAQRETLRAFAAIPDGSKGRRLLAMIRLRAFKGGALRKAAQMIWG